MEAVTTIAHQWDFLHGIYMRTARTLAADAGQMLYYVVARDEETQGGRTLTVAERKVLRHHSNPNTVGSRCGVLPIFVGMRVELSCKVSAKANVLKAAQGVVEHLFAEAERTDRLEDPGSDERLRGWAALTHMPAILLRVDGFTDGVIPGRPDLLIVPASSSESFTWKWKTTSATIQTSLKRFQLPLLPVSGATPFTAQGMTAEWALVHLERGQQLTSLHDWWSQVYVALSRPRHHSRLGHHGPVPPEMRALLALGPAPHIKAELARLRALAVATRPKVRAAARLMGWQQPGSELAEWRRARRIPEPDGWGRGYEAGSFDPLPPSAAGGRRRRSNSPAGCPAGSTAHPPARRARPGASAAAPAPPR